MTFSPYGMSRTRADELMKQVPYSRIQRFLSLPPEAPVRLHSFQGKIAWDRAEERGYWCGSADARDDADFNFNAAYDWMRDQMAERIPEFSGDLPMWGWLKRPSAKPKPKLYAGTDGIRLTVVVPRRRILISDFDTWHCVLNGGFMCDTETEYDAFYESANANNQDMIRASWVKCLEFVQTKDEAKTSWGSGSSKYFRVQACVDRFYWSEIESVRYFNERA